jgi:hypothetical protein
VKAEAGGLKEKKKNQFPPSRPLAQAPDRRRAPPAMAAGLLAAAAACATLLVFLAPAVSGEQAGPLYLANRKTLFLLNKGKKKSSPNRSVYLEITFRVQSTRSRACFERSVLRH